MNLDSVWNLRGLWPGYGGSVQRRVAGLRSTHRRPQANAGVAEPMSLHGDNAAAKDDRSADCGTMASEPLAPTSEGTSTQQGVLTEICTHQPSIGQAGQGMDSGFCQMLPALAGICQSRWLLLVAPPVIPSACEFAAAGIDPSRVLLVHPTAERGLSVIEQALRSGNCGAVLVWLQQRDGQTLRRLRRAAEMGRCWGVLFRPQMRAGSEEPAQIELGFSS